MEEFILYVVAFVGGLDFTILFRIFTIFFIVFWVFIVIWVWFDAEDKSNKLSFRVFSSLIVLFFNILGLIIYFLIRPEQSYEERYWQELEKKYLAFETCGLVNCSKCGYDLEPSFANCPECGKKIKSQCENCEEYIEKFWKFCPYCGVKRRGLSIEPEVESKVEEGLCENVCSKEEMSRDRVEIYKKNKDRMMNFLCKAGKRQNECMKRVKFFFKHGESDADDEKNLQEDKTDVKVKSKKKNKKNKKNKRNNNKQ